MKNFEKNYTNLNDSTQKYYTHEETSNVLKNNGNAIRYFENPTEELQILAVENTTAALRHIKKPTKKTLEIVANMSKNNKNIFSLEKKIFSEQLKEFILELNNDNFVYYTDTTYNNVCVVLRNDKRVNDLYYTADHFSDFCEKNEYQIISVNHHPNQKISFVLPFLGDN